MNRFEHQDRFLAKNPDKEALVWSCGTGKTRAACEWSKQNKDPRGLTVCPKPLKENWKRENSKWGSSLDVVTKEEFRRDWDNLPYYPQLIVDEVHNGFLTPMFKSQMSKSLRSYIKKWKTPRVLLLSATVYTSSPWNIYSLATLLGHHWDWAEFNWKYFTHIKMGTRLVPVPKKGVEKDMARLVVGIADVVDIHDCMDVPEQLHEDPEYYALTQKQEKVMEANFDAVNYVKQHEIENGVLIGDDNGLIPDQIFGCDKDQRILDLIEENKKVAVVCKYNLQIDSLNALIESKVKGKKIYVIRGSTKNRDEITLAAEAADDCVVLIQADSTEGYQLPSFGLCIFASMSYKYVSFEQVCGRFLRMDKPSQTTFKYLLTSGRGSIDQAVYDSIQKKEDFSIELYRRNREKV